ncbi:hypothetical protein ZIOFF_014832 [Zingiber officinale]|uniref:Uncharacterized protein n=1 Tax=Zingiber officinale TaxID=94328 RepID=A0A8J5I0Y2_ZINOF|nr:hypothetical protein ZIOFF_014832 [Zingiber officinale]
MLEKFDFPKGILPEGVRSYELKGDGSFTVFLASNCEFKVDGGYLLKYDSKITGSVARSDAALNFYVGPLSATFPVANFEECPRCRCGFDRATAGGDKFSGNGASGSSSLKFIVDETMLGIPKAKSRSKSPNILPEVPNCRLSSLSMRIQEVD